MPNKNTLSPPGNNADNRADVTITYLEQTERPVLPTPRRPRNKLALLRVENPPLHYYRYLYSLVGGPFHWLSRRRLPDAELTEIIRNPSVYIYVLYADGAPGGFAEVDARDKKSCEIRFFGLAPEFTGLGLGRYFLTHIIDLAWSLGPARLCLETCTLDHPAALPLYQKMGFRVFDRKKGVVELVDAPPESP
jgi:GNAT superfamily N-acetyltransferase